MAKTKAWKIGDRVWRGYARCYLEGSGEWWPEIRPAVVAEVAKDGTVRAHMDGVMPGAERKRTPGGWVAWGLDPANLFATPEEALRFAKRVTADARAEELAKAA